MVIKPVYIRGHLKILDEQDAYVIQVWPALQSELPTQSVYETSLKDISNGNICYKLMHRKELTRNANRNQKYTYGQENGVAGC